jgi:hypothetical protein
VRATASECVGAGSEVDDELYTQLYAACCRPKESRRQALPSKSVTRNQKVEVLHNAVHTTPEEVWLL